MCGICGTTRAGDGRNLASMNQLMRHRGPDDEGTYIDQLANIGLGARRLSVIDVAGGHQPISNEDGSIWAVLNGEIYNYPALGDRLRRQGHRFTSTSDTEVLVHAYEEYQDELVHALEGMFAFAIWDQRRRRLLLARDRFGEKPVFYHEGAGVLTFASELTALCAGASITKELSADAVDAFFLFGYVPGPRTIVTGVEQLPPGHVLTWDQATRKLQRRRYWAPPSMPAGPAPRFADLVDETCQLLESAVRSRMISDVPLGVFLSGGLDSTLVTALAARNSNRSVKTFTVGYDVEGVDETDAARQVAARLGTVHHELVLSQEDVSVRAPAVLAALDQPIADQALVASHALAEDARREVTVAVGGEGADELFGGYPRYRWLARSARLHTIVPDIVLTAAGQALTRLPLSGRAGRLREVFEAGSTLNRHVDWVTSRRRMQRGPLYGPRLRSHVAAGDWWHEALTPTEPGLDGEVADVMRLDQTMWLPDDVLAKADRASMLVSLEVRTPYLDRRLAEFACTIPAAIHCQGRGKSLLRAALGRVAPQVAGAGARPKTAFRVPAAAWLRGPLAATLTDQLRRGRLYREGWFDRDAVERQVEEHRRSARDWSATLWPLLALGLWMDRFLGES
jgi:asparagine synthase (glutamine-hydrolysing)